VEFTIQDASALPLLNSINEGSVDLGITVKPAPDQRYAFEPLLADEFVLVCRRDDALAVQPSARWSVFASRPFIASSVSSSIRPLTETFFSQRGLAVRPAFECANIAIIGALVAGGLGISAMPRLALRLLDARILAAVPLRYPRLGRDIGIVTRTGRSLSPAVQGFIALLKASAKPTM
jgi:LysR family carnitine catabolism transcriptional activator